MRPQARMTSWPVPPSTRAGEPPASWRPRRGRGHRRLTVARRSGGVAAASGRGPARRDAVHLSQSRAIDRPHAGARGRRSVVVGAFPTPGAPWILLLRRPTARVPDPTAVSPLRHDRPLRRGPSRRWASSPTCSSDRATAPEWWPTTTRWSIGPSPNVPVSAGTAATPTSSCPGHGSWLVLGSVVTDAPLAPTPPVPDGCGSCRRCLDGCPTGAIVAPGVVDARRCLAWLVQAEGSIPIEHRGGARRPDLRLRRLPGGLSPEPARWRRAPARTPAGGAVGGPRRDARCDRRRAPAARHGRWYVPRRDPRYLRRNALVALGNVAAGHDARVSAALSALRRRVR